MSTFSSRDQAGGGQDAGRRRRAGGDSSGGGGAGAAHVGDAAHRGAGRLGAPTLPLPGHDAGRPGHPGVSVNSFFKVETRTRFSKTCFVSRSDVKERVVWVDTKKTQVKNKTGKLKEKETTVLEVSS